MSPATETTTDGDAPTNVLATGGNLAPLKKDINAAIKRVVKLKGERGEINSEITKIKSDMDAKGITRRAFSRALQDYETSNREDGGGADALKVDLEGYWIAREAVGLPGQTDMFEDGPASRRGGLDGGNAAKTKH